MRNFPQSRVPLALRDLSASTVITLRVFISIVVERVASVNLIGISTAPLVMEMLCVRVATLGLVSEVLLWVLVFAVNPWRFVIILRVEVW
jgi:hypothetical protein